MIIKQPSSVTLGQLKCLNSIEHYQCALPKVKHVPIWFLKDEIRARIYAYKKLREFYEFSI